MGKRYTSVLVLSLLLVHLAGFYVYFAVRLGEVRMEMRKKLADLPDDQLQAITMPRASFKASWMNELEMKWEGKMYDIARVEFGEDEVIVFSLHDEDEDGLLNFITSVLETGAQDTREAPDTVIQFFSLKFVTNEALIPMPQILRLVTDATEYRFPFSTFAADPLAPPPRS